MLTLDAYTAFDITIRLVAIGSILSSFELITIRQQFGINGVFSIGTVLTFNGLSRLLKMVDRWLLVILAIHIAASAMLLINGPFSVSGRIMVFLCFLTALLIRWRRQFGGDGAEQMNMIVLITAVLALLPYPSPGRISMAVFFIAAQVSLSYLTAGIAKLIAPVWRKGYAMPAILSTYIHGHPGAAEFLNKYRLPAFMASWGVILFECLFPVLIMGPNWLLTVTLVLGLLFHLLCALFMGLNSFLCSFPAMYPCVIAVAVTV